MIQMNVRQQQIIDCLTLDADCRQRSEKMRHRLVGTYVDEGCTSTLLDDMRRRMSRADVFGIDGRDPIGVTDHSRGRQCGGALRHAG